MSLTDGKFIVFSGLTPSRAVIAGPDGKLITSTGTDTQYIRGDGSIADFPKVPVYKDFTLLTDNVTLFNFVGDGVTVSSDLDGAVTVSIPLSSPPIGVKNQGVDITGTLVSLDFSGAGVTAFDDGLGNVTVSIDGGGGGSVTYNKAIWVSDSSGTYNLGSTPLPNSVIIWVYPPASGNGASVTLRERFNISVTPFDYTVSGTSIVFNKSGPLWGVGVSYYIQWAV